jgi:hypothetical protein
MSSGKQDGYPRNIHAAAEVVLFSNNENLLSFYSKYHARFFNDED